MLINPPADPDRPAIYLFFNIVNGRAGLASWIGHRKAPTAVLQWMVDHPLHTSPALVDELSPFSEYRYISVADDDMHLMQMRWPSLQKAVVWHGVSDESLLSTDQVHTSHTLPTERGGRDIDVLFAGSIHTREELDKVLTIVPAALRPYCQHLVQLRLAYPHLTFGQAYDMTLPHSVQVGDGWDFLACIFRATTAWLNRERRLRVLKSLDGCRVTLLGSEAWKEHLAPGMSYAGHVPLSEVPAWMRRSKVCIAINPVQFTHSFSERLLQGMASGAACVTDDRMWVRDQFGAVPGVEPSASPQPGARFVDPSNTPLLRAHVDELLASAPLRVALAQVGNRAVAAQHRWANRVDAVLNIAGFQTSATQASAA
jgi:hypothetical protein